MVQAKNDFDHKIYPSSPLLNKLNDTKQKLNQHGYFKIASMNDKMLIMLIATKFDEYIPYIV